MTQDNGRRLFRSLVEISLCSAAGELIECLQREGDHRGYNFKVVNSTRSACHFSIYNDNIEAARGSIHRSYKRRHIDRIWVGLPSGTDLKFLGGFEGVKLIIIKDEVLNCYVLLQLNSFDLLRTFRGGLSFDVFVIEGRYFTITDGLVVVAAGNEPESLATELYKLLDRY